MTVEQMFLHEKVSTEHLNLVRDESTYWERSGAFVLDNWQRDLATLSQAQAKWINRIYDDLVEMRIERKGPWA